MRANYKVELAAGLFLVIGLGALLWLATQATDYGRDIGREAYTVSARFTNVGDLRERAPVKIAGVPVGLVDGIEVDPVTFEAVVQLRIDNRFNEVPTDTSASILTSGVLGDRYVGLEPGGSPMALVDGDELMLTQSAVVLEQLVSKFLFNAGDDKDEQ
ncbi:outer membrane lipid asymmetry maintenance protein MlaD [Marinihelvus fidelis]|uniref:Outer membrane lipid asymmetry maintenance protein MlaD n=1 Tax=Marinihelvus fidelis TaxID=2613842 RepID=A0A5N0T834_9GAMM|nr:outer membrane lipid asymmetry maintenance protein MlaD [Marinihelvus fidelis]KAA9130921.1 outer membrane lipid asymmetry maintenance protein MlaD [Marinihelvus fidelis]